jgi:hypothetical protein
MATQHLAYCFGLLAAAGMLAVRFGTLPYSETFVLRCVRGCYRRAKRALKTEGMLLQQAISIFRKKIKGNDMIDLAQHHAPSSKEFNANDGYVKNAKATIRAGRFKAWFRDPRQPALVLQWLNSKRALYGNRAVPAKLGTSIVWAERQPTWPDGDRRRSFVIDIRCIH